MKIPSRPALRRLAGACLALLPFLPLSAADAIPEGWFAWPSTEPADGSALDVSPLNAVRGAALPRISVRDGRFVTPDGARIRFWGANVAGAEAFPATAAQAELIARQFAKGGVNIVRLHHLDNAWGVGSGGSIWPADRREHREFDPVQLDRLHRFIAVLRDHGLYSNLNLKVSKTLAPEDGFDASVTQIPDFQKRIDIYDRRMIDLQKDYARRLLTTKNPYTGLAPAEDPAIAIVELNNENSIFGYWTRDLGRGLDKFPAPFVEELRGQWNVWLARRYADDAALAAAWAPAGGAAPGSLIPGNAVWQTRAQPGSAATAAPGADATAQELHIAAASGIDWHVQVSLRGLALDEGAVYTIEFRAKASQPRKLGVGVGLDAEARPQEPWRSFGLLESVDLDTDWRTIRLVFPAHSTAGAPAALSLNAGQTTGTISIADLKLVRDCAGAGLQPGQSARAGSVPLPLAPSAAQWADWIHFLADTERAFAEEMRDYLINELHVQAPVVCSQLGDYGGLTALNRERAMEFADVHAYWQHPDFPGGGMWNPARWTIRNSPQLDAFADRAFGELGALALLRVAGKPFTLSEYDHPAPGEFVCEMYPEVASFAARQDWDIVYPFSTGAYGTANPDGRITDFFDQLHHPAKWSQSPFAALVLRRSLVPPATRSVRTLHLGSPVWAEQPHADVLWRALLPEGPLDFLNIRYAVSDVPGAAGAKATVASVDAEAAGPAPVRIVSAPQGRVYVIDSAAAAAAVGYLGGATVDAGALRVAAPRFGRDFASVTAVALDGRPLRDSARVLVTVVARASNQGLVWNEAHNSVGLDWGHGPTIAEHVPATVTLAGAAGRAVYPLAPDGTRRRRVEATTADGALTFTVGAGDRTLHYEIVAERN